MTERSLERDEGGGELEAAPLVSIVILSYNRPKELASALDSVLAQTYQNTEVLVIDNRSPASGEVAELVRSRPRAALIANTENLGFTGGMNQGLALARGKYVHLTEDDITMHPECVRYLVNHLEANEDVALASGVMLNPDETVRCAGGIVRLDSIYRSEIIGAGRSFDALERTVPYDVSYVPGAFICVRKSLLADIGAFNDDFYMYFEDTELCARVLKAGYKVRVIPNAHVLHAEPPTGDAPDYVTFHRYKNFLAMYLIHADLKVLPEFVLRSVVLAGVRNIASKSPHLRQQVAAWKWAARHLPKLLEERKRVKHLSARHASRRSNPPARA